MRGMIPVSFLLNVPYDNTLLCDFLFDIVGVNEYIFDANVM